MRFGRDTVRVSRWGRGQRWTGYVQSFGVSPFVTRCSRAAPASGLSSRFLLEMGPRKVSAASTRAEPAAVSHTLPATRSVPPTCGIARGNGRWLWFALQLSLGTQVRARLSLVFTFCVGRRSGLGPEKEGPRDCGDLCSGRTRSLLGEDAPRSRALHGSGRIAVRFPA